MPMDRKHAELLRQKAQLLLQLAEVEDELTQLSEPTAPLKETKDDALSSEHIRPSYSRRRSSRTVRETVLDALDDLGFMAYSRELSLYIRARHGRIVPPTRFGTLSVDERRAHQVGKPRAVWLCHGLTYDRGESIQRLWARSDWPFLDRIVAPTTGTIQHLKMTARLAEIARSAGDTSADPAMLCILAADHARDLPDIKFKHGKFDLELWRDTAQKLLEEHEPRDRAVREEAAERLSSKLISLHHQLFGIPEALEAEGNRTDRVGGNR